MGVVRDWRGTKIVVGSVVVYPSRQGSRLWMSEGVVARFDDHEGVKRIGVRRLDSGRVSYPDPQRLTVVG